MVARLQVVGMPLSSNARARVRFKLFYLNALLFYLLAIMFLASHSIAAQGQSASCVNCHLALGIEKLTKPAELYNADIHAVKGFGCVACHGGDPNLMGLEAMDRKKGYIGKPTPIQVVDVCGK